MKRWGRSLADASPGQTVTVARILFDHPRARCSDLGLSQGDRVNVERREGEALLVGKPNGELVRCPAELARFIAVERTLD